MGGSSDDDVGYSIITDNLGNVYTVGRFSGSVEMTDGKHVQVSRHRKANFVKKFI
ncbi:SBBP repeat-containing protein [Fluviicola taffensis]